MSWRMVFIFVVFHVSMLPQCIVFLIFRSEAAVRLVLVHETRLHCPTDLMQVGLGSPQLSRS
jgi:hypothetical protein